MFNFIKQQDGAFAVSCRMFEIWFYEYFISQDKNSADFIQGMTDKNQFIHDGILDILLSFCFNKTKQAGLLPPVELNGRILIEAIV